jgi:hypothetical protein
MVCCVFPVALSAPWYGEMRLDESNQVLLGGNRLASFLAVSGIGLLALSTPISNDASR